MPAADPAVMKIVNPATGAMIADIPEDGAFAVRKKYERARAAQPAWAATPIKKRVDAIRRFRDCVTARHETLARTLTAEVGKPIVQSRNELNGLLARLDFFGGMVEPVIATETVYDENNVLERIEHAPLGVIANISAWNYPWFVGCNVITGWPKPMTIPPRKIPAARKLSIVFIDQFRCRLSNSAFSGLPFNGRKAEIFQRK